MKYQINVINNKREDDTKAEDGEIIDKMHLRYIDDKYKDLIKNIFTQWIKRWGLQIRLQKTVNIYIYIEVNKSVKNLTDSGSKVNMIENSYAPKTDVEIEDKFLNKIK